MLRARSHLDLPFPITHTLFPRGTPRNPLSIPPHPAALSAWRDSLEHLSKAPSHVCRAGLSQKPQNSPRLLPHILFPLPSGVFVWMLWHDTIFSSFSPASEAQPMSPGSTPVTQSWGFSPESSFNEELILRLPAQQMFLFVLVYVYFNSDPNVPFITSSGSTSRPLCCSRQSLGGSELCYLQISAVRFKELAKTLSCKLFFSQDSAGFSQCSCVPALLALAGIGASCHEQSSCPFKAQPRPTAPSCNTLQIPLHFWTKTPHFKN